MSHASQGNLEMFDIFGRGASLAQFEFGPIDLFASLAIAARLPQKFPICVGLFLRSAPSGSPVSSTT